MARQLRWGVLSTAGIGRNVVTPALQHARNGTVVAVASRDEQRAREYASALGIGRVHPTYQALLDDPDIDAVYIPLPNALHAEWTIKAAQAGKAVLCDKPLAATAADAARAIEACAKHGVPLMEGFMWRFHPQTLRVRELIASGAIGGIREVRAQLSVNIMNPADPKNIRYQRALGGGALLDMGCYAVNVSRAMFGQEPKRVIGWRHVDPRYGVDTSAAAILEFEEGIALASCSFQGNGNGSYVVIGTKASIEVPRGLVPGFGTRNAEGLVIVVDGDGNRKAERFAPANQYQLMAEAFADAVLEGKPVPLPPQDSLDNMRVLDAIAAA
jgi:predicted dehydrogenase